jgi:uncharacterized repeat protein (TIGR01451 family)
MNRITRKLWLGAFCIGVVGTAAMVEAGPNVTLTKKCPPLRYVGREATFEITISNTGDAAAQNVVVTDMLPDGVDYRSADNGGAREGNRIVWRVGALEAGQSRTFTTSLMCNRIGRFKNTASVTYCAEVVQECEVEVKGIPAILLECVDNPDPIEVGSELTYTITVTNQGSAVGTNIALTCTLPTEEQYVSSDGPTKGTAQGQSITFAPLPTLAPRAAAVYKLTVKGLQEGDVRFRVDMRSDQLETPVMETESTHIY